MEGIPTKETPEVIIGRMETELNHANDTLSEIDKTGHLNEDSVGREAMEKMTRHIQLLTENLAQLKKILKPSETES